MPVLGSSIGASVNTKIHKRQITVSPTARLLANESPSATLPLGAPPLHILLLQQMHHTSARLKRLARLGTRNQVQAVLYVTPAHKTPLVLFWTLDYMYLLYQLPYDLTAFVCITLNQDAGFD